MSLLRVVLESSRLFDEMIVGSLFGVCFARVWFSLAAAVMTVRQLRLFSLDAVMTAVLCPLVLFLVAEVFFSWSLAVAVLAMWVSDPSCWLFDVGF